MRNIFLDNNNYIFEVFPLRIQKSTITFFYYHKSVIEHQVVQVVVYFLPVLEVSVYHLHKMGVTIDAHPMPQIWILARTFLL